MAGDFANRRHGFTLIEVLVVVAIIALLISILLPSLAKARDQAKEVVCASRLSQAARGEAAYETMNRQWFPGSPLTTGYNITSTAGLQGTDFNVVDWLDYSTPLRKTMYGRSSAPNAPGNSALELQVRYKQYSLITAEPFLCPVNNLTATPYLDPGYPVIHATSYITMWTLVRGGPGVLNNLGTMFPNTFGPTAPGTLWNQDVAQPSTSEQPIWLPGSYAPNSDRLGLPSIKVFLADGLRYYQGPPEDTDEKIDYSSKQWGSKGMMSGAPPSVFARRGTTDKASYAREYGMARKYSYRHGAKDRINAACFDGHVASLVGQMKNAGDGLVGRMGGSAVNPKYYYPSKSVVNDPTALHVDIPKGTALE